MIGPHEDQACPEWDEEMKSVVEKHQKHMETVVGDIARGLPEKMVMPRKFFEDALRHAFEGGLEAITKNIC